MKKYSDEDNSRTDVNGAWNPLKPITEGFEFIGDEQYDDFSNAGGKEKRKDRREEKRDLRKSGVSRKEARKQAKLQYPTNKPARKGAYLTLVKLNFKGFAYKLDSIITGSNIALLNQLKEKWRKYGDFNELVEAVNTGKEKKPFICGAKCRKEVLPEKELYSNAVATVVIVGLLSLAGIIIESMSSVVKQAQIGKQQREAIASSEKLAKDEFDNLPQAEKNAIIQAENELRKDIESNDNKKYIYIGIGVVALIGIIYLTTKKK